MAQLLHIIATPRQEASRTLKVSNSFLEAYLKENPDSTIDELNLFKEPLPELVIGHILCG